MRQLWQEANGVHIKDCHVTWQLACMDGDVQGGKKLVSGFKTTVTGQGFNQSRFSWADRKSKELYLQWSPECASRVSPLSPQLVYPSTETIGNSLCLRWARRRCLLLRSFSSAERIFISRSFSSLCWTSNKVSPVSNSDVHKHLYSCAVPEYNYMYFEYFMWL